MPLFASFSDFINGQDGSAFKSFLSNSDWRETLEDINENWDYYTSFNEQLYGERGDYSEAFRMSENFGRHAEAVLSEARQAKKPAAKKPAARKKPTTAGGRKKPRPFADNFEEDDPRLHANMDADAWDAYKDRLRKMFDIPKEFEDDPSEWGDDLVSKAESNPKTAKTLSNLLSASEDNPKTAKILKGGFPNPHTGEERDIKNAVLHLLPAGFSGCNTCSSHTPECAVSCLDVAGNMGLMGNKTAGRAKRTYMFAYHKNAALTKLANEIEAANKSAGKKGHQFAMRLNGTSDMPWEAKNYWFQYDRKHEVPMAGEHGGATAGCPEPGQPMSIFCHFPDVQFYDYTKNFSRAMAYAQKKMPKNYHLTFSFSEKSKISQIEQLLDAGGTVAMVFAYAGQNKKVKDSDEEGMQKYAQDGPLLQPKVWRGDNGKAYPIITGDTHDFRFVDRPGCIVSLAAKGDARFVKPSGPGKQVFVVQPDDPHVRYEPQNRAWILESESRATSKRKDTDERQAEEDKELAKLKAELAALPPGPEHAKERRDLESKIARRENGEINFFGPEAQRRKSNWIYQLVRDRIDAMREKFREAAVKKIAAELQQAVAKYTDEHGKPPAEQEISSMQKEIEKKYYGLPQWTQDTPHLQPHQSPALDNNPKRRMLGLPVIDGPTELDAHVKKSQPEFDAWYGTVRSPASGPTATPLGSKRPTRRRVAEESYNPYLEAVMQLVG